MTSGEERQDKLAANRYLRCMSGISNSFRVFIAALAGLLVTACAQFPAPAAEPYPASSDGPALWRMADEDTELMLFGTVHLLPEGLNWQREAIIRALENSDIFYLETDIDSASRAERLKFRELGMAAAGQSLQQTLPPELWAKCKALFKEYGLSSSDMNTRQAWLAAITLSGAALQARGFLTEHGAEEWLLTQLDRDKTEIRSLEGLTSVAELLSALGPDIQTAMIAQTVADTKTLDVEYSAAVRAWATGDSETLKSLTMDDMAETLPEVYEALLVKRNANWLFEVERLMQEDTGTAFMAVGSGHLIGPGSLIDMLRESGWQVDQF